MSTRPRDRDRGLTLVELIIVTTLLGLVATVIAAAFITILQVTPSTQFRIDDARSTRGLQTYLARDIASTPPNVPVDASEGGYLFSGAEPSDPDHRCNVSVGTNVLHMQWKEAGSTFYANYRLVPDGSSNKVIRYYCTNSTPTAPTTTRLTSEVSSTPCTAAPFSEANLSGGDVVSVDLCFVSIQSNTGLQGGGGDSKEITLTVSSRNWVDTF